MSVNRFIARLLIVDMLIDTNMIKNAAYGGVLKKANVAANQAMKLPQRSCMSLYSINVSASSEAASSTRPSRFLIILTVAPVIVPTATAAALHIS